MNEPEYDISTYVRKWLSCLSVWKEEDGLLNQGVITDFYTADDKTIRAVIQDHEEHVTVDVKQPNVPFIDLQYYPIKSGVYTTKIPDTYVMLVRKHVRSFSVGVGNQWVWHVISPTGKTNQLIKSSSINLLKALPQGKGYTGHISGYLDKKLWWTNNMLLFQSTAIGGFKGTKLKLSDPAFISFVAPLVGDTCSISLL